MIYSLNDNLLIDNTVFGGAAKSDRSTLHPASIQNVNTYLSKNSINMATIFPEDAGLDASKFAVGPLYRFLLELFYFLFGASSNTETHLTFKSSKISVVKRHLPVRDKTSVSVRNLFRETK
jgi:hypothetical protein